jgi:hypothetical protein
MTRIVVRADIHPTALHLRGVGPIRATVGEVVGTFGSGPWVVEYLTGHLGDKSDETGLHQRADHAGEPVGERGAGG